MRNNNKKTRWGVVDFALVDQGISPLETVVYSYIKRFQRTKGPIWASIPYIARDLRMSESSVQRYIKHLIKVGLFKEESKGSGRGRYLSTTPVKLLGDPCQSDMGNPCQTDRGNPCQSDMLSKLDNRGYISKLNNRETSSSKLASIGLEFYKDVSLVKDNPELAKVSNADDEAREAHEKAEYLRIKKELLSKAKSEPVDYSDLPD